MEQASIYHVFIEEWKYKNFTQEREKEKGRVTNRLRRVQAGRDGGEIWAEHEPEAPRPHSPARLDQVWAPPQQPWGRGGYGGPIWAHRSFHHSRRSPPSPSSSSSSPPHPSLYLRSPDHPPSHSSPSSLLLPFCCVCYATVLHYYSFYRARLLWCQLWQFEFTALLLSPCLFLVWIFCDLALAGLPEIWKQIRVSLPTRRYQTLHALKSKNKPTLLGAFNILINFLFFIFKEMFYDILQKLFG